MIATGGDHIYVTKNIFSDSFIISIPVITLSLEIRQLHAAKDFEWLLKANVGIGDPAQKEKLVEAIKEAIA